MDTTAARTSDSKPSSAELAYWKARVRLLPDVRLDKVMATRDAIKCACYENEGVVDEMIQRLTADLASVSINEDVSDA